MTEDEIRDLFREMREDAVPADSLARVRFGVEGRIRRRAHWKIAAWVMAGAMVILAALITHPRTAIHKPATAAMAARRLDAPPLELPQATTRMTVRPAIQRKVSRRPHRPSEAVTIRIETPDPDVVILLVSQ
jgi:hypothetical protein